MISRIAFSLVAILVGALETAGGAQELIYQGILRSRTYPLVAGTLGTLAGVLLLAGAFALLLGARPLLVLAYAACLIGVPAFILIGVVTHIAGWPITAAGIVFPLVLLAFGRKGTARAASRC